EGSNDQLLGKDERNKLRVLMTDQKYHNWYMSDDLTGPERRKLNYPGAIIAKYKAKHPTPEQQAVRNAAAAKRAEQPATKPSAGDSADRVAFDAEVARLKAALADERKQREAAEAKTKPNSDPPKKRTIEFEAMVNRRFVCTEKEW